jgi:hypothetical protein
LGISIPCLSLMVRRRAVFNPRKAGMTFPMDSKSA